MTEPGVGAESATVLLIAAGPNTRDSHALAAIGMDVLVDPYLVVQANPDPRPARRLLAGLDVPAPGWLVVTSARAYPHWGEIVGRHELAEAVVGAARRGLRAAAVGPASAVSLPEAGWPPAVLASPATASGLLAALAVHSPGRALIPHGDLAGPEPAAGLRDAGWEVLAGPVYTTGTVAARPPSTSALRAGAIAAVVLRSPSAVRALLEHCEPHPSTQIIAGGPTTAAAARAAGLEPVVAPDPSPAAVAAVARAAVDQRRLSRRPGPARPK